jgi:mRNA-degrading endonuclease toxin of MazEF toxin-antitoxin module
MARQRAHRRRAYLMDRTKERAGGREMNRGEVWLVSLDPTSGHEQRGRRPVLIVSPEPFNRVTKVPVVLPITSGGNFARIAGFAVPLTGAGIKTTGIIRCDQPRALDLAARGGRKLESIPHAIMEEVLARILPIFE